MFPILSSVILSISVFCLVCATTLVICYIYWFSYWKKQGVEHVKPVFPFGNARDFILGRVGIGEQVREWYLDMKKRGWSMGGSYFAGKAVYIPVDEKLIKQIMIADFSYFPNRGFFVDEEVAPFSGHILNMEGYKWKNLRAKLPGAFTAAKMRTNFVIMERISRLFTTKLNEMTLKNKSVNIKEILSRFTTDMFTACAFGMKSQTLDNNNKELLKQSKQFFEYQWSRTMLIIMLVVPRRILSFLRFKILPADTTRYFMDMFRKIKAHREKETGKRNDLTDLLIDLCDESRHLSDFIGDGKMQPLNFNQFASQMYVFFEAGFETSSSTQTFALYELAANPEIQERLREDIDTILGKYNGEVGYDSINEMEYLDRVVDETLRKYPILPVIPRKCVKDYHVPNSNVTIEKDSMVMISSLGIHNDPSYYPNPSKFDPDRFTPENKAKRPHCSYLPFGEGPRICIGKRFGIWQTKIGILSVIRNFKISLSKKMKLPVRFDTHGLLLKFKEEVWIDLEKIN